MSCHPQKSWFDPLIWQQSHDVSFVLDSSTSVGAVRQEDGAVGSLWRTGSGSHWYGKSCIPIPVAEFWRNCQLVAGMPWHFRLWLERLWFAIVNSWIKRDCPWQHREGRKVGYSRRCRAAKNSCLLWPWRGNIGGDAAMADWGERRTQECESPVGLCYEGTRQVTIQLMWSRETGGNPTLTCVIGLCMRTADLASDTARNVIALKYVQELHCYSSGEDERQKALRTARVPLGRLLRTTALSPPTKCTSPLTWPVFLSR